MRRPGRDGDEQQLRIVAGVSGPTLLVATGLDERVEAIAAAAASVDLVAPTAGRAAIARALRDAGVRRVRRLMERDARGRPRVGGPYSSAVLIGLDDGADPQALLEIVLDALAHDGFLFIDLPRERLHPSRFSKLLAGGAGEITAWPSADHARFAVTARRRAPGRDVAMVEATESPAAVIATIDASSSRAETLVAEILFRQSASPACLVVVDASSGGAVVPDDLWGMAPHAPCPCALIRRDGAGTASALAAALESIDDDLVYFADESTIPTANWLFLAAAVLDANEDLDFVAADVIETDAEGAVLEMLRLRPSSTTLLHLVWSGALRGLGDVVFRRRRLTAVGGVDVAGGSAAIFDALLRVAEAAAGVVLPLPLLVRASADAMSAAVGETKDVLARARRRGSVERLAAGLKHLPPDSRRREAAAIRLRALLAAGAIDAAAPEVEAMADDVLGRSARAVLAAVSGDAELGLQAIARDVDDCPESQLARFLCLRLAGRDEEAVAQLRSVLGRGTAGGATILLDAALRVGAVGRPDLERAHRAMGLAPSFAFAAALASHAQ